MCNFSRKALSTCCGLIMLHPVQGRIQDFKLGRGGGRADLKKLGRTEGGAKMFGVFRVKNHDFTPKNHIFSNFRGGVHWLCPSWIRPCSVVLYFICHWTLSNHQSIRSLNVDILQNFSVSLHKHIDWLIINATLNNITVIS